MSAIASTTAARHKPATAPEPQMTRFPARSSLRRSSRMVVGMGMRRIPAFIRGPLEFGKRETDSGRGNADESQAGIPS